MKALGKKQVVAPVVLDKAEALEREVAEINAAARAHREARDPRAVFAPEPPGPVLELAQEVPLEARGVLWCVTCHGAGFLDFEPVPYGRAACPTCHGDRAVFVDKRRLREIRPWEPVSAVAPCDRGTA